MTAKPIMASPTDVVSGPSFPNPEDLPQNGIVVPPSAQKKAKKIACCLCLMSPCLCMWGCFNAVTSRLNRMTCGCLYEAFPCLDFD
ncbi:MAG: hypothetical protein H6925_02560 [Holosporaceae bacterium]|nr:MAG: hypothetical protein H6925_02560 [Holosporaceae bacterium]